MLPELEIANHHPERPFPVEWLKHQLQTALKLMLDAPGPDAPERLDVFDELEISLVDDATIADVHLQFMDIPGATDVITFHHGEILISLDTAAAMAPTVGHSFERETLLYAIHGLLHLHGFDDLNPDSKHRMDTRQWALLNTVDPS